MHMPGRRKNKSLQYKQNRTVCVWGKVMVKGKEVVDGLGRSKEP